jgi:hypothetical protein
MRSGRRGGSYVGAAGGGVQRASWNRFQYSPAHRKPGRDSVQFERIRDASWVNSGPSCAPTLTVATASVLSAVKMGGTPTAEGTGACASA